MTQWPTQRNVYTLVSQNSPMNKSIEATHVLTTHNTNTPSRLVSTTGNTYDDSLTNLSWLHDINILKRTIPTINSSSSCSVSLLSSVGNVLINHKRKEQSFSNTSISPTSLDGVYPNDIDDKNDSTINHDIDDDQWKMYRTNPHVKPVYSYCQLILLAMRHSGQEKLTLQMIYEWIEDHFPYFKKMEPTWQNSIRHNLSSNKCFIKVPRHKRETTGKGGFWKLSSDYQRQCSPLKSSSHNQQEQQMTLPSNKRIRSSKRTTNMPSHIRQFNQLIKSEAWSDPILPCIAATIPSSLPCHIDRSYVRMPSSFLSPISSPDSLPIPPFHHHQQQQQFNDFSSTLSPSASNSPSSMSSTVSKQNFISTKLDDADMLLLDSVTFDWDAYLCETPNDIDLSTRTEQDLFNDFNAALTDLTYSAEATAGGDQSAFDGFDYPTKHSTFTSLFDDDEQHQQSLKIKGRGIKRPLWWLTTDSVIPTKLPSLETAFDLKLFK